MFWFVTNKQKLIPYKFTKENLLNKYNYYYGFISIKKIILVPGTCRSPLHDQYRLLSKVVRIQCNLNSEKCLLIKVVIL